MLYEIEWTSNESSHGPPEHYGSTIIEAPDPAEQDDGWYLPVGLIRHAEHIGRDWARANKIGFVIHVSGYTPAKIGFDPDGRNVGAHSWRYLEWLEPPGREYDQTRAARLARLDDMENA